MVLGSEKRFTVDRRRAHDCKRELERERVVLEVVVEDELSVLDRVRTERVDRRGGDVATRGGGGVKVLIGRCSRGCLLIWRLCEVSVLKTGSK